MYKIKNSDDKNKAFILYSTLGCHLCEQAELMLNNLMTTVLSSYGNWQIEVVDIANDESLMNDYGIRIPVLVDSCTKAELSWPFDDGMAKAFLLSSLPPRSPCLLGL